jgi:4-hydroxybenzoate polyprenyltransferase
MSDTETTAAEQQGSQVDPGVGTMALGLLKTLRPHQWIKNLFVLAPLFFSKEFLHPETLSLGVAAAFLFCLGAGSVYLINDIFDVEKDKKHPVKCKRPIPSGQLPIPVAQVAAMILSVGTVALAALIDPMLSAVIGGYVVMNLAYSSALKHVAFVDVSIIATGFVLRLLAGKYAIGVYLSEWLIGCTFLLALYLGLGKRVHELRMYLDGEQEKSRKVLDQYRREYLDFAFLYTAGLTIAAYTIYTLTAALPELTQAMTFQPLRARPTPFATPYLPTTILFTVFGITRFYQLAHTESPHSPTDLILKDWPFIGNLAAWGVVMVGFSLM